MSVKITKPSILPGFMELTPRQQVAFNHVYDVIKRNYDSFCFLPIDTPIIDKSEFIIAFQALGSNGSPIVITQNEFMRRMKEMAAMQPGMNFYGELPSSYNLTLNTDHPVVKKIMTSATETLEEKISPLEKELEDTNKIIAGINDSKKDNAELSEDNKKILSESEAKADSIRKDESSIISAYGNEQSNVKQLVDIALLGNGLLKGEALNNFLKRSVDLL